MAPSIQCALCSIKTRRGDKQVSPPGSKLIDILSKKSCIFLGVLSFLKTISSCLVSKELIVFGSFNLINYPSQAPHLDDFEKINLSTPHTFPTPEAAKNKSTNAYMICSSTINECGRMLGKSKT